MQEAIIKDTCDTKPRVPTLLLQWIPCVNMGLHGTFLTEWNCLKKVEWKTKWVAEKKNTVSHNLPFINSHKWEIHLKMEILKQSKNVMLQTKFLFFFLFFCVSTFHFLWFYHPKGTICIGKYAPGTHLSFHLPSISNTQWLFTVNTFKILQFI